MSSPDHIADLLGKVADKIHHLDEERAALIEERDRHIRDLHPALSMARIGKLAGISAQAVDKVIKRPRT